MATNYNNMKKEELIEELQKSNEVIEGQDKELKSVKSDINSLKEMILAMKKSQEQNNPVKENRLDNDIVKIGSCLVGRHILCDNNGSEVVDFVDFGDIASIGIRILDTIMTPINKELFRKGLVYFLDDRLYDRYSIKKDIVLDDEEFDKIYSLPIQKMLEKLDKLTEEKTNKKMEHQIYWKIVQNIASGREGYQDRGKEIELNAYFGVDISNSINLLKCAKELEYK